MANASILGILQSAAEAFGIPTSLFTAQAQQESGLNPNAYNAKSGATGLLQLEPPTAAQYGVTGSALLDPAANANAGASYLADLYAQYGNWPMALAAFDYGPGNLGKAISSATAAGDSSNWLAYTPAETQNYVSSILSSSGLSAAAPPTPAAAAPPTAYADTGTSDQTDVYSSASILPALPSGDSSGIWLLLLILGGVYFGTNLLAEAID